MQRAADTPQPPLLTTVGGRAGGEAGVTGLFRRMFRSPEVWGPGWRCLFSERHGCIAPFLPVEGRAHRFLGKKKLPMQHAFPWKDRK